MKWSLRALCDTGYFYCERCEKIVVIGHEQESPANCPKCGKRTAIWCPPVNLTTEQN